MDLSIEHKQIAPATRVVAISGRLLVGPGCLELEALVPQLMAEGARNLVFDLSLEQDDGERRLTEPTSEHEWDSFSPPAPAIGQEPAAPNHTHTLCPRDPEANARRSVHETPA